MASGTNTGQPGRPYSGPDQLGGNAPRSVSFETGQAGDPDNTATATVRPNVGLTADSLQFRAQTPAGYRPSSVLVPIMKNPGGNGMSASQAALRFPDGTSMGNANGISADQLESAALLKMSGLNSQ